jgi:2,4-dienoyl-CoA reductase-like NADH-dependent reductase (Old Yellow Enzyme family)
VAASSLTESKLFSPLNLCGLVLRNRAVLSPMCQYQAVEGRLQDWHFAHHARFAAGGWAAAFVEATAVTRDGRITHGCTGIWDDGQVPGLERVADLYRANGVVPGIQLAQSGRRGSALRPWDGASPIREKQGLEPAWQTVAPSAIPERDGYPVPRELDEREIEALVDAFAQAAKRARAAGFDIVEIHGAHGYLIHSFFSPHSNRRTDAFGGTRERRMRFPLLVADAVRKMWPADKPVFYRASVVDNVPGGLAVEDSVALSRALRERGVDLVDCSSGGMSGPATLSTNKIRPGYQVPLSAAIRREAGVPTMAVGAILEPRQAESILRDGDADLVALGREALAEPHWPYRAALELGAANPHALLSKYYAFYLERRAAVLER